MNKEELIKILENYKMFFDDDFGESYESDIAYALDKKLSKPYPIGILKIIDTFEEMENQNKKYKELINEIGETLIVIKDYVKDKTDNIDLVIIYNFVTDILKEIEECQK